MKDGSVLSTYEIQDGHTVHLVAKPIPSSSSATDSSAAMASTSTEDASTARSTGPRFTFANRDDDEDAVGTAARRNRENLRRLMRRVDSLERDDGASEATTQRGLRESSVLRPQMTSRRRAPGLGEPAGDAWNMEVLREALGGSSGSSDGESGSMRRLHGLRELFGDAAQEEASPSSVASEMGLGSSLLNSDSTNRDEARMNLDHILQGMMTLRTVLSTVAVAPGEEERIEARGSQVGEDGSDTQQAEAIQNPSARSPTGSDASNRVRRGRRRFFIGQWLDVKDTVNQWLECTVLDISEDKVLVHYHGWPSRWDEWIDFDSTRIAAFRTRTLHSMNSQHMSPVPTTRLPNAPSVGGQDVREMVSGVRDLMREIMPHVERFAELCEEQARAREQLQRRHSEEGGDSSAFSDRFDAQRTANDATAASRCDNEVSEMAHLVAPLFDRFGRLLTDSARCLEPLLLPELQSHNSQQRQAQESRASATRNRAQRQPASPPSALERQDTSLAIRDLIATSSRSPNDSQSGRRNIDVHIHAIVAPSSLTSLASLARAATNASILQATNATAARRLRAPSTPPIGPAFEEAFGLPSLRDPVENSGGRALLNDEDDDEGYDHSDSRRNVDHSRQPLLSSFRRRSSSTESDARRRRNVDQNLEDFLADDFFGASHGSDSDGHDDDAAAPANSRSPGTSAGNHQLQYHSIPSPSLHDENRSERSANTLLGVIPEVAEANERARERHNNAAAQSADYSTQQEDGSDDRMRGNSSSSSSSSSSSNSSSYPSFLEFMRRSLSRNFGFSSSSETRNSEEDSVDTPARGHSSSSSSYPTSPPGRLGDSPVTRRFSPSSGSSIEEDLDELD